VKFTVRERDLGSTVAEAQARIARNVRLPSGYRLVWAGEFGQLQAAKERLAIVIPVSLVLILGLLYALFNSARECLLALLGIPFVIAGGIFALYLFGLSFSISAAIGFVSLFGVAVMIGILMITTFTQERQLTRSANAAMFRAATRVMRPLLMMSLSAGIGLLPAALSAGIGSEVQRPLAAVVVGGMLLGSILLLVVVPACYLPFLGRGNTAAPEEHP
jgi:cobalt-zinc-cadmium resistance protein CzcA